MKKIAILIILTIFLMGCATQQVHGPDYNAWDGQMSSWIDLEPEPFRQLVIENADKFERSPYWHKKAASDKWAAQGIEGDFPVKLYAENDYAPPHGEAGEALVFLLEVGNLLMMPFDAAGALGQ